MEDSAQKSVAWWKLVLVGVAGLVVFGVSILAGYMIGGERWGLTIPTGDNSTENQQATLAEADGSGTPKPVKLEIVSELLTVRLADGLNEEVLIKWLEILGIDGQAVRLKELGGEQWYTPATAKIVLKDISPLSADERSKLYKPVSGRPQDGIVAGWATEYDASQPDLVVYNAYYWPELFPSGDPVEVTEANVNRLLFELVYEAAIGSTAMTPDDYQRKLGEIFENWQGQGVVELSVEEPQTFNGTSDRREILSVADSLQDDKWGEILSVEDSLRDDEGGEILSVEDSLRGGGRGEILSVENSLQDDVWGRILSVADSLRDDIMGKLVGQAYAQTCGGNWKCGLTPI
jgi:hypothetical protein